jgi:hypothetical protein
MVETVLIQRSIVLTALAVSIACGHRDVSVRYLRSDSYTFSKTDRRAIERVVDSTTAEVRRLLPDLPPELELTVRPRM